MLSLYDLENTFYGEDLHILGYYGPISNEIGPRDYRIALGSAVAIFDSFDFWCSESFTSDWSKHRSSLDNSRIFAPDHVGVSGENVITYEPYPIWVMPPEELTRWLESSRGSQCPVGVGDFSLALGLAFRLGFKRVVDHGGYPKVGLSQWRGEWVPDARPGVSIQEEQNTINQLAEILGLEILFNG